VIVDRREEEMDLGGGERPAGLRTGADLGVERESLEGVARRGEKLISRTERAMREVLRGLAALLVTSSSSSRVRLRLPERLRVFGSMFSALSMKMEFLAERVMPGWGGFMIRILCMERVTMERVGRSRLTILLVLAVQFRPH
jgi:hypothetical protein